MDWLRHTVSAAERVVSRTGAGLAAAGRRNPRQQQQSPAAQRPRSLAAITDADAALAAGHSGQSRECDTAVLPRTRRRSRALSVTVVPSGAQHPDSTTARPHSRDIKCVLCYDQRVMFANQDLSQQFRRWFVKYQGGSEHLEAMQDQYRLLFDYVEAFNQHYTVWAMPPQEHELCASQQHARDPDENGHPSYAVICAVNALDDMAAVLRDAAAHTNSELFAVADDLFTLLQHVNILTRWPSNCRCMIQHQLGEVLLRLLLIIVAIYKKWARVVDAGEKESLRGASMDAGLGSSDSGGHARSYSMLSVSSMRSWVATGLRQQHDDTIEAAHGVELSVNERETLEQIVAIICNTMRRLADPSQEWLQHLRAWTIYPDTSLPLSPTWLLLSARRSKDFYHDLIRSLQHFVLHLQRDNAPPLTQLQSYVFLEALHLIGALVWRRSIDHLLLQELSLLDVLTALIGRPRALEHVDRHAAWSTLNFVGAGAQMLRAEFRAQLLTWRVIFAMELAVPIMRQHYLRSVTRSNLTELFRWASEKCLSTNTESDAAFEDEHCQYSGLSSFPLLDEATHASLHKDGPDGVPSGMTAAEWISQAQTDYETGAVLRDVTITQLQTEDPMPSGRDAVEVRLLFKTALSMLLAHQLANSQLDDQVDLPPLLSPLRAVFSQSEYGAGTNGNVGRSNSDNNADVHTGDTCGQTIGERGAEVSPQSSMASLASSDATSYGNVPLFWEEMLAMIFGMFGTTRAHRSASSRGGSATSGGEQGAHGHLIQPYAQLACVGVLMHLICTKSDHLQSNAANNLLECRREWSLRICTELRVWDTLFSDTFYLWRMDSPCRAGDQLRVSILQLLVFSAAVSKQPIQAQCGKLLALLFIHRDDSPIRLVSICRALLSVLVLNRDAAQEALKRLDCLSELTSLLRECAGVEEAAMMRRDRVETGQPDNAPTEPGRRLLFWILLPLLDQLLLRNRELAILARRDEDMLGILFGLLFHVHAAVSQFAVHQLVNIITAVCIEVPTIGDLSGVDRRASHSSSDIIAKYLAIIPGEVLHVHAFDVQLRLAHGVLQVVHQSPRLSHERYTVQRALVTNNVFEHLLTVLRVPIEVAEWSEQERRWRYTERLICVARALIALCADVPSHCEQLAEVSGYYTVCEHAFRGELSEEVFTLLCDLLANQDSIPGEEPLRHANVRPTVEISNSFMVEALAVLLPTLEAETQSLLLEWFIHLAEKSDLNRWFLAESSLAINLLRTDVAFIRGDPVYITRWTLLLECVCSYSVRVQTVKSMLDAICHRSQLTPHGTHLGIGELPANHSALLRVMYTIAQNDDSLDFFHFRGDSSGLWLGDAKIRTSGGIAFFTWIRLDRSHLTQRRASGSNASGTATKDGNVSTQKSAVDRGACLFSLQAKQGCGLEVFIENGYIQAHLHRPNQSSVTAGARNKLVSNRWYFVAVSLRGHQRGWGVGQSELTIYIDDTLAAKALIDDTSTLNGTAATLDQCAIGARLVSVDEEDGGHARHPRFTDSLRCKMTTIYIMEDSLSARQAGALYQLGRRHVSRFHPEEAVCHPKQCSFLFESGFAANIVFCFHANAVANSYAFNLASYGRLDEQTLSRGLGESSCPPGQAYFSNVECCSTTSLQRAISSLGGIEVFFPLVLRFDAMATDSYLAPIQAQDDFFSGHGPVQALFLLISAVLRKRRTAQEHSARSGEIRLISFLLQQVAPRHMSPAGYRCIVTLANTLVESDELTRQIYRDLLMEFRLWVYTSMDLQRYCLHAMKNCVDARMEYCRNEFGLQYFIDALHTNYWYAQHGHSIPAQHAQTGAKLLERPEDIAQLRSIVLDIMRSIILRRTTRDDVLTLLRTLASSTDQRHTCELVLLIVDLLHAQRDVVFMEHFVNCGGYEVMCELLKKGDVAVKIAVIQLMRFLLGCAKLSERWKRKLRFEDLDAAAVSGLFVGCQLTQELYRALLALAVEEEIDGHELLPPSSVGHAHDGTEMEREGSVEHRWTRLTLPSIRSMKIIVLLLEIASNPATTYSMRIRLLQDMLRLFRKSAGNCARLRLVSGWQRTLIELIPPYSAEATDTALNSELRLCQQLSVELLAVICWNLFDNEKSGQRMAEEALLFAWTSTRRDRSRIVEILLTELVRLSVDEIEASESGNLGQKVETITWLLVYAEDFMFSGRYLVELAEELKECNDETSNSLAMFFAKYEHVRSESLVFKYPTNPWDEQYQLTTLVLRAATAMDETIVQQNRWHQTLKRMRPGGYCRLQMRLLLAGIMSSDASAREQAAVELLPFLLRHITSAKRTPDTPTHGACTAASGIDDKLFSMLGQIHEIYMISRPDANVHGPTDATLEMGASSYSDKEQNDAHCDSIAGIYRCAIRCCRAVLDASIAEALPQPEWPLLDEDLSGELFEMFISSTAWSVIYDELLVPALKAAEEDEFSCIQALVGRFVKDLRVLLSAQQKRDASLDRQGRQLHDSIQEIVVPLQKEESARLSTIHAEARSDQVRMLRRWRNKQQELERERDANTTLSEKRTYWKLDRAENTSRMRRRMVVNYDFDDHRIASARRDKVAMARRISRASKRFSVDHLGLALQLDNVLTGDSEFSGTKKKREIFDPTALDQVLQVNTLPAIDGSRLGSGIPEEDEWNLISGEDLFSGGDAPLDRSLLTAECELVVSMSSIKGVLELTYTTLAFILDRTSLLQALEEGSVIFDPELLRDRRWSIADIYEVHFRKHLLRKNALEFFMCDRTSYFFHFPVAKDRLRLYGKLVALRPPSLVNAGLRSPAEILRKSGVTQRWMRHEISNFDYLMHLNSIAGRTYNDITQYFVFPWILTDYASDQLDLSDPAIYRDLSKPVGALDAARLETFNERYESFDDPTGRIKKFHYGTHYSSAATVAFYLLRLEPFTSIHISLQGGKFDYADRQFHSIQNCWHSCLTGAGDVKELVPEFFYLPEFLVNDNDLDLGVQQNGERLGDVVLPPWAASAEDFVRIHREALESDYVSENLHQWIDLIFGYKQNGEEAVKAHNVFYYLTYEGAINIDAIVDPIERKAVEEQIYHFGQTPTQLLRRPHPRRASRNPPVARNKLQASRHQCVLSLSCNGLEDTCFVAVAGVGHPSTWSSASAFHLIAVDRASHVIKEYIPGGCVDRSMDHPGDVNWLARRRIPSPFSFGVSAKARCFAFCHSSHTLFSAGHWDDTLKLIDTDSCRVIQSVPGDNCLVTCSALSEDARWLITGSRSSAVFAWNTHTTAAGQLRVGSHPCCTYHGHVDEVTTCDVNAEHDLLVSGSKDGTCIVHALRSGDYLRTIRPIDSVGVSIERVLVTRDGNILVCSGDKKHQWLSIYTINGRLLKCMATSDHMQEMAISADGRYVAVAYFDCRISILEVATLSETYQLVLGQQPTCLGWLYDSDQPYVLRRGPRLLCVGQTGGRVTCYRLFID